MKKVIFFTIAAGIGLVIIYEVSRLPVKNARNVFLVVLWIAFVIGLIHVVDVLWMKDRKR